MNSVFAACHWGAYVFSIVVSSLVSHDGIQSRIVVFFSSSENFR